jgi:hypothetical protein
MANLFDKSKKTSTKTTAKKNEKIMVTIPGDDFSEALDNFAKAYEAQKEAETTAKLNKGIVLQAAKEEYAKLIVEKKSNVGSFNITSEKGGRVMLVPMKKYLKIDKTQAKDLVKEYGEDIVTENTVYKFNAAILEQYADQISELIEKSNLPQKVKDELIEADVAYSVEKDSLDKTHSLAIEKNKEIIEVLEDIQPIYQVKNPKASN